MSADRLVEAIRGYIDPALDDLHRRIDDMPVPIVARVDALQAQVSDIDAIESAVSRAVGARWQAFEASVGEIITRAVSAAVEALPKPRDGIGAASAIIDQDGKLVFTMSDGSMLTAGQVVGQRGPRGEDGRDGKDGLDGLGFDDLDCHYDGERTLTVRFVRGEQAKEFPLVVPIPIDRGVWREGSNYERGDVVSFGGSMFVAQQATADKPEASQAWRLAVKRGRDGRSVGK